jgi:hypothetical protein
MNPKNKSAISTEVNSANIFRQTEARYSVGGTRSIKAVARVRVVDSPSLHVRV